MSIAEQPAFDNVGPEAEPSYTEVRDYVRRQVTQLNVLPWLATTIGQRALDFGGQDGRDTIWLANQDFEVTLLNRSSDDLAVAARNIATQSPDIRGKIKLVHGNLEQLSSHDQFDVVLHHHAPDPRAQLKGIGALLRRHGILSLLVEGLKPREVWRTLAQAKLTPADDFYDIGTEYTRHDTRAAELLPREQLETLVSREFAAGHVALMPGTEQYAKAQDVKPPKHGSGEMMQFIATHS